MNSLQRRRWIQVAGVVVPVAAIAIMLILNASDPNDTEADQVRNLTATMTEADWKNMTPERQKALREQWEALSPDARTQVFKSMARVRLDELRARTQGTSPEERADYIRKARDKMREQHENIPEDERARVRERLNSDDGKEMIKTAMDLYANEFTARERAELDPLVHEWLYQIEKLAGDK